MEHGNQRHGSNPRTALETAKLGSLAHDRVAAWGVDGKAWDPAGGPALQQLVEPEHAK